MFDESSYSECEEVSFQSYFEGELYIDLENCDGSIKHIKDIVLEKFVEKRTVFVCKVN